MQTNENIRIYPKEFNYKVGDKVKFRKIIQGDISEFYQKFPEVIFTVLKIIVHGEPEDSTNNKWTVTNLQRLTINLNTDLIPDYFEMYNENWLCPHDFNQ